MKALARWKANPQPLFVEHPAIMGRRVGVKVARRIELSEIDPLEAPRAVLDEIAREFARRYLVDLARQLRLEFDRKARRRKKAARARCGRR